MAGEYELKMAVIAGASHALKFKEQNPRASDNEIMQHVADKVEKIVRVIFDEE